MIEVGDKFACFCLQFWATDWTSPVAAPDALTSLCPFMWAADRLPFELSTTDRERVGSTVLREIERSHLYLVVTHRASDPEVQDLEMTALARRATRLYAGLLLVTPGISIRSARLVDGVRLKEGFRYFHDSERFAMTYQAPGTPASWGVAPPHLHHAVRVARGSLATHGTGDFHRMGRVSAAMSDALGARELATRLQQSIRALEGLILPQTARGTAGVFSDRLKFFCGAQHVDLLRHLYRMRGKVEHLHGPIAAVKEVRPDIANEEDALVHFAFAAFVAENMARACVVRVYETEKLWPFFRTDAGLEKFWTAPGKTNAWGSEIDLAFIVRAFEPETARRQLKAARAEESAGERADAVDQAWIDADQ